MLFLSEEGDIQIKRGSTRKLQCGPYWVISALECSDKPIGSCPLRSFTEWAAYIIALNPGLWHSHWTEGSIGFCGWREEGRGDGRKVGGAVRTHILRDDRAGVLHNHAIHSWTETNFPPPFLNKTKHIWAMLLEIQHQDSWSFGQTEAFTFTQEDHWPMSCF